MGWKLDSAGKWLINAAGKALLCNCCNGGERYWQGRSCTTGEMVDYWIDGEALDPGVTCVTKDKGGAVGCVEWFVDYPRTDTEPATVEANDVNLLVGYSCCRCASGCSIDTSGSVCCCGKSVAGTSPLESQDCEWRLISYVVTLVAIAGTCDGVTITRTTVTTFGTSAWMPLGRAYSPTTGTQVVTYSPANGCWSDSSTSASGSFRVACSTHGHLLVGGVKWYLSGAVTHANPGDPGCLHGDSLTVTDTSGSTTETIEAHWEVRCASGLQRPCRNCDAKGIGGMI